MTTYPATRPASMPRPMPGAQPSNQLGFAPIDPLRIFRQYKWWLLASIAIGAVVGIIANMVMVAVWPFWRAEVVYQCLPVQQDPTKQAYPVTDKDEMERFLLTTATVMNSDRILRQALIDSPAVFENDTRWGRLWVTDSKGKVEVAKGLKELKKIVSATVITGTNLVRLSVTTQNRDDSAAISKAVHDSYWKDWKNLSSAFSIEQRGPLEEAETSMRSELNNLDAKRDRMLVEKQIDDLRTTQGSSADKTIEELSKQIGEATRIREQASTLIKQYEALNQGGGVTAFPDELIDAVERDQVIVELKARLSSTRSELAGLDKLGVEHPTYQAVKSRMESIDADLTAMRQSQLRKLFDGELDRSRRQLESTSNQLAEFNKKFNESVARKREIVRTLAQFDQLENDRKVIIDRLETTRGALNAIRLTNISQGDRIDRVRILTPPNAPDTIYFPKLNIMIPLGIIFGFALTAGFIFLRELMDQRIKGPSDLFSIPRVRLLGAIPSVEADPTRPAPETALRDAPTGAIADGYRQTRSGLIKRMQAAGYKSLLVFGGNPQSGATSAAANLALGSAQADQKVLLIDANFRRPALHKVFKLGEGPGLGEILARKTTLESAVQQTSTPNLHLLAAGAASTRSAPERLSTDMMSQLIQEASQKYDIVIIDTAPAAIAGDAAALANRVDASVMVVRALGEKRGLIARLRDVFSEARAEFMGVLINGVRVTGTGYMAKNIRTAQEYQNTAA